MIRAMIMREIHLINDLKINMFIENDILKSEKFHINFENNIAYIDNCDIFVFVNVKRRFSSQNRFIHIIKTTIISPRSEIAILIHHILNDIFNDKNYFFESKKLNLIMYAHLMNVIIKVVLIRNDIEQVVRIFKNTCFDRLMKMNYLNIFHITIIKNVTCLIKRKLRSSHKIS